MLLLLTPAAWAAPPTRPAMPATRPLDPVRKLILQLDDEDPDVRERASLRVNNLPGSALGLAEAALASPELSPESEARLRTAVKYIRPRAAAERERLARASWESRSLHDAYQKFGHTSPEWDAQAHQAIDLYLKLGEDPLHGAAAPRDAALAAFHAAAAKGCDDPLIFCLLAGADGRPPPQGFGSGSGPAYKAAQHMVARGYPPAVKLLAVVSALGANNLPGNAESKFPGKLMPDVLKQTDLPPGELEKIINAFYDAARRGTALRPDISAVLTQYHQLRAATPGPTLLEVRDLIDNSLDPFAPSGFTPGGREGAIAAQGLLKTVWESAPDSPAAPTRMLVVLLIVQAGPEEFDPWFERAMQANPDNYNACTSKLKFLDPSRHGTGTKDILEFGRSCLSTNNWRGRLPYILIQAHERAAELAEDRGTYFLQPVVWEDGRSVYEGALLNATDEAEAGFCRSEYAKWAVTCARWREAAKLFDEMGDHPDLRPFVSQENVDYYRRKAKRLTGPNKETN